MSEYKAFYNHDELIIGGDSLLVTIERENISRTGFESRWEAPAKNQTPRS